MLKVCSLFSGIGGIDLGFKQAGFEIVWANEIDASVCKTYVHNLGNEHLVQGDIKKIKSEEIPDFDILVAGFPCQPFSLAGKQRGFCDDRGQLFFEIKRIIHDKQPKIVFLENVANLIEHDNGKSFEQVYLSLMEEGYAVRYDTQNSKTHANIPQQRNRVFIVAFLDIEQCNKFKYPKEIPLTTKITDIIDIHEKHDNCYYYTESHPLYKQMCNVVKTKGLVHRINDYGISKNGYTICPTLTANMGTFKDRVSIIKDDFGIRKLTPFECLKLQGYPDYFSFPKGITLPQAYKQVGNSVCVPIIYNIAKKIYEVINLYKNKDK